VKVLSLDGLVLTVEAVPDEHEAADHHAAAAEGGNAG
jgi:hypothetical protein